MGEARRIGGCCRDRYRVTKPGPKGLVDSPVYCKPTLGWNGEGTSGRLNVMVKNSNSTSLRTTKRGKLPTMEDLEVVIPLSKSISNVDISVTHGTQTFDEARAAAGAANVSQRPHPRKAVCRVSHVIAHQ